MSTQELLACVTPGAVEYIQKAVNSKNKADYQKLKKLFDEQRFEAKSFDDTDLDILTFDWQNLERDRNWWWQLQALPFLNWYANSLALQSEEEKIRYFLLCLDAVHNWIDQAKQNKESPLAWHDHAAAFRVRNLANLLVFCHSAGLSVRDEARAEALGGLVIEHLDWLQEDKHYSKHTNHGFDQAMIALTIGLMFNHDEFGAYRQRNRERLKDEVTFAFTDEGVHKENSPGYQKMMLGRLKQLRTLAPLGEQEISLLGERYIEKAEAFLRAITLPNGYLPMIGDTRGRDEGLPYKQKEKVDVLDYSVSGYIIVRGVVLEKDFHLVFKASHLSHYHRHDDDLSIHLYWNGHVILGDAGLYSHNEGDDLRRFVRSPLAHSTVFPNNYRAVRKVSELHKAPRIFFEKETMVFIARTSCYGGDLERRVSFSELGDGALSISDRWVERPAENPELIANFFVKNFNSIKVYQESVRLSVGDDAALLTSSFGGVRLQPKIHYHSDCSPVVRSVDFGKSIPACRVFFAVNLCEKDVMEHRILLEKGEPSAQTLIDNVIPALSDKELSKHLWSFSPSNQETPTDLSYIESVLGSMAPSQMSTDLLYLLIRTYFWMKKVEKSQSLVPILMKRLDVSESQLINTSRQMAFSFPMLSFYNLLWIHKTLKLIHHSGYGRFSKAYISLAKKLREILGVNFSGVMSDELLPYPDLIDEIKSSDVKDKGSLESFISIVEADESINPIHSLFSARSFADIENYLRRIGKHKVFREINEAVRGLLVCQPDEVQRVIELCFEKVKANGSVEDVENEVGLYLEIIAMLNSLHLDDFLRDSNYRRVVEVSEDLDRSSCFASALAYYAMGMYSEAEVLFRKFSFYPKEGRFYHQSAGEAFRKDIDEKQFKYFSSSPVGNFSWFSKPEDTGGLTILVSCDPGYFLVYASEFLERLESLQSGSLIHFHVVCTDEADFRQLLIEGESIVFHGNVGISFEVITFGNVKTYSSLARYLVASSVMSAYQTPVFVADIDLVLKLDPKAMLSRMPNQVGLFFGTYIHNRFPWQAIKAGAGLYPYNTSSQLFLELVGRFMSYSYVCGNDGWMLDQMALEYAYRNHDEKSIFYCLKEKGFPITQVKDRPKKRDAAKKIIDLTALSSPIMHYSRNKNGVVSRLRSMEFSTFKVALKTKDESDLLERWINHYGEIFGYENIIIFDNESTDSDVLKVYERYNNRLGCLLQYGLEKGSHNSIHYPENFPDIYEEISKKCKYFAIFDTDEFLFFVDGLMAHSGASALEQLSEEAKRLDYSKIIYCFWLNEMHENRKFFKIGNDNIHLYKGARDGKHFLPSSFMTRIQSGHNSCTPSFLVPETVSTSFYLFHTRTSTPERRARVNFNKLVSRGAVKDGVTLDDFLREPSEELLVKSKVSRTTRSYLNEFKSLSNFHFDERSKKKDGASLAGGVTVNSRSELVFTDEKAKVIVREFVASKPLGHALSAYFRHSLTCDLNKTPMIELGVYGEVEEFTNEIVKGWVLDTLSDTDCTLQLKVNSHVYAEFQPDLDVTPLFSKKPLKIGFLYKFSVKDIQQFCDEKSIIGSPSLRVVVKRVRKSLKGLSARPLN